MSKAAEETRKLFISWGFPADEVDAFIEESGLHSLSDPQALRAAREVVALCRVVGKPGLAAKFVASGLPFSEVQRQLREVCGNAGPVLKAPQARAAIKGNPRFDAMARAQYAKRGAQ